MKTQLFGWVDLLRRKPVLLISLAYFVACIAFYLLIVNGFDVMPGQPMGCDVCGVPAAIYLSEASRDSQVTFAYVTCTWILLPIFGLLGSLCPRDERPTSDLLLPYLTAVAAVYALVQLTAAPFVAAGFFADSMIWARRTVVLMSRASISFAYVYALMMTPLCWMFSVLARLYFESMTKRK